MKIYTTSEARSNLYRIIDNVAESHEPVVVKGKRNRAVIISKDDYENMKETIHILSIPGMLDSIIEGVNQPIEDCTTDPDWDA